MESEAYVQPWWSRFWPIFIDWFNHSHIMVKTWYREIGWIVTIISCHQNARIWIDAEKVGCIADALNLVLCECGQSWSWESLLFAVRFNAIDHHLRIITVLWEYRMSKPTQLFQNWNDTNWIWKKYYDPNNDLTV